MMEQIPWFPPEVGAAEAERLTEVIASGYLNDGPVTREFERRVAAIVGVKHCVGVTSGTAAISLALMAAGIGPGDEVIVPDLTFIATANAVRMFGAVAKLVDVEPRRFTLDLEKVQAAIGPRTRAVVPVDVNGRACDYEALEALCRKHDLVLVSDAAEALGSAQNGRMLGSFGQAGCFSFSAAKTVTTGQGGMVATNDTAIYHRLLELKDQGRRATGTGGNDLHPVMGYNFKLTNLQAAVGLAQLDRMPGRIAHFQARDLWYRERLEGCPGLELPPLTNDTGEVRQWTDVLVRDRDGVEAALKAEGIGCRPFWYPLHRQDPYALPDDEFAASIDVSYRGLWLPSAFTLTEDQADRAAQAVRRHLMKAE